MQDEENKDIVDSHGNILKRTKNNKFVRFLKTNIWNILGIGLAACITFEGIVNSLFSKGFSISCANFYGMDKKYFDGTEMFEDKLIFVLCALALFAYPFLFSYVNKRLNSKVIVIVTFLVTILILFVQNMIYTVDLIDRIPWDWLKRYIDNYVAIGIFFVADILIAYFIIIRNFFRKNKRCSTVEKIFLTIALLLYVSNMVMGITSKINYEISDKKAYETIEQDRAIVSVYDGKFVVMDCQIQDETIILKKGTYSLEEMTGVSITYHEYEKVVCE